MTVDPPFVTLRVMTDVEFADFLELSARDYIAELVQSGVVADHDEAVARATRDIADVRSDGPDGERNQVFAVLDAGGDIIGALWLGARDGWARTWIYDIRVDPAYQGRGLGRATLVAGEQRARELGAAAIGLHVFADNVVARSLYASSGYLVTDEHPTDLVMWKDLAR